MFSPSRPPSLSLLLNPATPPPRARAPDDTRSLTGPPPTYDAGPTEYDPRMDRLGEEIAPDSNVWSTYIEKATIYDTEVVGKWNQSLDTLLIFASVFSAVVTTFAVESSRMLQPDYSKANALLAAHMLNTISRTESPLPGLPPPEKILAFEKAPWVRAVNVLWYSALSFSLASILIAMLAKQWLVAYASQGPDEPQRAACERQRKFDGLHKWSLPHLLTVFPALLHLSLFLFLVGLIIYMWQLDSGVSCATCLILGILFIFYFASGAIAAFSSSCPYVTPVSQFAQSRLPQSKQTPPPSSDLLVSRAISWLATATDPKAVGSALQSLAGLRRGFKGYQATEAGFLARLAFEHLQKCFVSEWRHGGTYDILTEKYYEASCYARTLMHLVDDPRSDPSAMADILREPTLPIFLQRLGYCPNRSIALLALCDYQRLLHRTQFVKWKPIHDCVGTLQAADAISTGPAKENMNNILRFLNDYLKNVIFLHPFAIEIAVETIGYAPLPWILVLSTGESALKDILIPLLHLLHGTRDGVEGLRHAIARTLTILSVIHDIEPGRWRQEGLARRLEGDMLMAENEQNPESSLNRRTTRELLLSGLSNFVKTYEAIDSNDRTTELLCEELFYEGDSGQMTDLSSGDALAVAAFLPLLSGSSLDHGQMFKVLTRLLISAQYISSSVPSGPFPPDTVSVLLTALNNYKGDTFSWLGDMAILLYLITCIQPHRSLGFANVSTIIHLISNSASADVANFLFWMLTKFIREAITSSDSKKMKVLLPSEGIHDLLLTYRDKYGLTPADVHMWVDILPLLPAPSPGNMMGTELVENLLSGFEAQSMVCLEGQLNLRTTLFRYSGEVPEEYTRESALQVLQTLKHTCSMPRTPRRMFRRVYPFVI